MANGIEMERKRKKFRNWKWVSFQRNPRAYHQMAAMSAMERENEVVVEGMEWRACDLVNLKDKSMRHPPLYPRRAQQKMPLTII